MSGVCRAIQGRRRQEDDGRRTPFDRRANHLPHVHASERRSDPLGGGRRADRYRRAVTPAGGRSPGRRDGHRPSLAGQAGEERERDAPRPVARAGRRPAAERVEGQGGPGLHRRRRTRRRRRRGAGARRQRRHDRGTVEGSGEGARRGARADEEGHRLVDVRRAARTRARRAGGRVARNRAMDTDADPRPRRRGRRRARHRGTVRRQPDAPERPCRGRGDFRPT